MSHPGLRASLRLFIAWIGPVALADDVKPEDGRPMPVKLVSMQRNISVPGTIRPRTIKVDGELGILAVPMAKLVEIAFAADTAPGGKAIHKLTTTEGHVLVGVIVEPKLVECSTEYGEAKTDWNGVRTLTFDRKAVEPPPKAGIEFRAEVEMASGVRIEGEIILDRSFTVHCQFGKLDLDPEKVRTLHFDAETGDGDVERRAGTITTVDGRKLVGQIETPESWLMFTDLGALSLTPPKVREIRIEAPRKPVPPPKTPAAVDRPGSTSPEGAPGRS